MKLTTAILAASLFMYVGGRNGTGDRIEKDTTKYIITWLVYKSIEIPCPDQWSYDIEHGRGSSCMVYHAMNVQIEHNAGFLKRKDAYAFYNQKISEYQKGWHTVWDAQTGKERKEFMATGGTVDSVRIDSIEYHKPTPSPLPDTTKPPGIMGSGTPAINVVKYRYTMKPDVKASLDSIDLFFMPVVGQTLTVDQANQAKTFLLNQIYRILQYARLDSVKIEGGGK